MRFVSVVFTAWIPLSLGCGHAAAQAHLTWAGDSGISVSVADERCDVLTDPDFVDNDLVEISLTLDVANSSGREVTLHRDRLRLMAPDGVAPSPSTWGSATPISISPGQTAQARVSFVNRGSLRCDVPLDLNLKDVLTSGASPLDSGRIRLLAKR